MAYILDDKKNKLIYLYQLKKEKCSRSFGINVAKIAGLPVITHFLMVLVKNH